MKLKRSLAFFAPLLLSACLITDSPYALSGDMPLEQRYWQMCSKTPDEPKYSNCFTASVEPYSHGASSGWTLAYYPSPGYLETHSFEAAASSAIRTSPGQFFFIQMKGSADNRGFALKDRTSFGFALTTGKEVQVRIPECDPKEMRRLTREMGIPVNDRNPCDITGLGYSLNDTAALLGKFQKTKLQMVLKPLDRDAGFRKFLAERDGRA